MKIVLANTKLQRDSKSEVWSYFQEILKGKLRWNLHTLIFKIGGGSCTSNLCDHVKGMYQKDYKKSKHNESAADTSEICGLVNGRQNAIEEIFSKRIVYIFSSNEAKRINKVVVMFAHDFQPITTVEEGGFKDLL